MSETHNGITFNGDPHKMQTTANNTHGCHVELEARLSALANLQDELHAAVVSQGAGSAIYNALGNAHTKGKALSSTLQEIVTTLSDFGVNAQVTDDDIRNQINRAAAEGGLSDGTWSGSEAALKGIDTNAGNFKVDTSTWA
ncbi:hypothetical protein [Nocardia veterana]|uniref:Uncharacterized protein n=1 Tax=Nocardia veterana TaxID=132249 RepID=A0A7X6RIJ4_9NOCA|nr:hypothetical protein [Nocardia veterana]NKY87247.1 hypothetical protein [Nocardia veterana]